MFTLFKDAQQVTPIFADAPAQGLYTFMEKMRKAALNNEYSWSGYSTLQQYAKVCFWAIRKMEYGFIVNQFNLLEKQFNRPLRILDAGCGVVPLNNWLASQGHEVVAFDPLQEDIEFLVKNDINNFYGTDVRYLTAQGEHLPFPSQSFDVVTFVSVLEHTIPGNDRLILNEFARVLRPGGYLLMTFDVAPTRPVQDGEDDKFQDLRRYGYPFIPTAAQDIVRSLESFFRTSVADLPAELYDLTWENVHTFWHSTQSHDDREQDEREYLALGMTLQRNQKNYDLAIDNMVNAYWHGQKALEEQLNFYRYHAENRQNLLTNMDRELEKRAEIIKNFQRSIPFWFMNGPTTLIPILKSMIALIRYIRRLFLSKLGVLQQYGPRPMIVPRSYIEVAAVGPDVPNISIVTPSYNQAEFIERTVQSVLSQNYQNLEYVVQDGASKDNTLEILEKYKDRLTYLESRQDSGQAHAINLGFQHTYGEIMAYLNSDDILLPGALNYVANYFLNHPEVDVIYSHRIIIDEKDREIGRWIMPPHDNNVLYWADYIPQETLFWRRSIWDKAGGSMDMSFNFALDWDLLLRFQKCNAVIHRVSRFLAAFRVHGAQKTATHMNLIGTEEMQRIRKKYLGHDATHREIFRSIKPYLNSSIRYDKLYWLGIYRA